jgi:hypothetical protein
MRLTLSLFKIYSNYLQVSFIKFSTTLDLTKRHVNLSLVENKGFELHNFYFKFKLSLKI